MTRSVKRSAGLMIGCGLIALFVVGDALAGAAGFPPPPNTKIAGPAVSGTIIVAYPLNTFAIRLTKGTRQSGAAVLSFLVNHQFGCSTDPTDIANRFLGGPSTPGGQLGPYFNEHPAALAEIFQQLGITLGSSVPIITDVNNATCSSTTGTAALDVTIQFAIPK